MKRSAARRRAPRRARARRPAASPPIPEVRVRTWAQLNEELYAGSWRNPIGRYRSRFAFRGMQDVESTLATALQKLAPDPRGLEQPLLRNFRKFAQRSAVPEDSVWNWLALGQHHGLPTRLLDWTFSPYVALHFATAATERFDRDAVVWVVDYGRAHELLPGRLRTALRRERADVLTAEMLSAVARSLSDLDSLARRPFVAFFDPPSLDDRIVNQYALFSLLSSPTASLDEWLRAHPGLARRIVVPAALKWEVRDKLDQANLTERVLFPGLDGLSRWLRRYYMPRD
ncbi:MAG: FRG domain-containing protein [Thermoanaerobaculia bacterium]